MAQLNLNKSKILFFALVVFSALFIGVVCFALVNIFAQKAIYLVSLPVAMLITMLFIVDRRLFFIIVILIRASIETLITSIKFGSFGLGAVLNALVILIAILTVIQKPLKSNFKVDDIKLAWIIFLGLAFISIFYAPVMLASMKVFLILVSYCAIFVLGLHLVDNEQDLIKWLKLIVYSSFIPSIYAIASIALGLPGFYNSLNEGLRLQSTFGHPNTYAPYLVIIITICLYLWRSKAIIKSPKIRVLLPMYIGFLIFLLVMTKTRSTWAACYVMFLLYAFIHERKFLLPVLIAPFFALLIPEIRDRLVDLESGSSYGVGGYASLNSYAWRKQVWTDAINWMSETRYFFGYGLASFIHYSTSIVRANAYQLQKVEINVHSVYVQLFFELGIFGLFSFTYLIYAHLKTLFSVYQKNKVLVFMVCVTIIEFLFMSYSDNMIDYLIYEWYLWFTVGITLGSLKMKSTDIKNKNLTNTYQRS